MQQTHEYRVLLLPATRRDAEVSEALLQRAGLLCTVCTDARMLAAEADASVGVILLTDHAFHDPDIETLLTQLAEQPPWSDIPSVLLCRTGHGSSIAEHIIAALRNVTVLERPASIRTLISSLKAALRARERQYQMREQFSSLGASEAALKKVSEALLDTNRRKDEFLAMLAHELRNPLAPIQTASEVLARQIADPQQQKLVSLVKRQCAHLTRLVDDLLDMSRITKGRIELRLAPVEVGAIIAQARETVEPLIRDKGQTLVFSSDTGPLHVKGDHARLVQSVANILTNAAKYTDHGGEIRLSVQKRADEVMITVTDNGVGIPPELLPRLFDLFVQGDRSLARSQGGLGIGLSVVKRLIGMHGGLVTAYSEGPGLGSTFEIRLPLIEAPAVQPPVEAAKRYPGKRILVVDDNEDAANSLASILELEGHSIDIVYTGRAALERALAISPEVILLDVGLPDISGYEVARHLRPLLMTTQIVALTGYGHAEDIRRASDAGFDAHVIKPVDFEKLTQILGGFDPGQREGQGVSKRRPQRIHQA
jgi:signal transduction histidine kinase/ActR/RegA family two-component response regulator